MAIVKTRGLVIKQSDFGEANRIITIFTKEYGIITAAVYGAKSIRNKNSAPTQLMTYADFVLTSNNNSDVMSLKSAEVIESFYGIKEDIVKLSLCVYFADLSYSLLGKNVPDENVLSLFLNSVYALSNDIAKCEKVRAVFELRIMAYSGYMPNLRSCCECGNIKEIGYFSVKRSGVVCKNCKKDDDIVIDAQIFHTLAYILLSESKKMLSFEADDDTMKTISKIAQEYIPVHNEKNFESLTYYKNMLSVLK